MEAVEWLKKSSPEVAKMYDGFIKKFGHRCLREVMQLFFEKSTPWEEDCTPLIETLQSMVSSILRQNQMKDPSAQKHRQLTLEQRIDKMKTQLDEKTK